MESFITQLDNFDNLLIVKACQKPLARKDVQSQSLILNILIFCAGNHAPPKPRLSRPVWTNLQCWHLDKSGLGPLPHTNTHAHTL